VDVVVHAYGFHSSWIIYPPTHPIPHKQPEQAEEGMEGGKLQLAKHLYLCFRRRKHNK
jgi:hypothetical protein